MSNSTGNKKGVARCSCGWKTCRAFQRGFRDGDHPVFDGVIKFKLHKSDPEHLAYKNCLDRVLKIPPESRTDWKGEPGNEHIKYVVARHHYTEKHIQKYLKDPKSYSFTKPFSIHGARKYLFLVDTGETVRHDNGDLLYLQVPNVSKEHVKSYFMEVTTSSKSNSRSEYSKQKGGTKREDSLTASTSPSTDLLAIKEEENTRLKDQLETMQSQLTFLHDMVRKLQEEHLDHRSVRSGRSGSRVGGSKQGNGSVRSARKGVPQHIEIGDEDEWNEPTEEEWSENIETDTDEGTFQSRKHRRQSIGGGSVASTRSRATSIVSASKSIKSLPREIELDEDEDDSDSHESLQEEAFDNRSFASSRHTKQSVTSLSAKKPHRRLSQAASAASGGTDTRHSASRRTSNQSDEDRSVATTGCGTHPVTAITVTDPYGEQGKYTGSISNSTSMPHGYGRLEYDRAGRWYEGDWKHGRWTGHGRLSNGDGDYYEGGLKNDHKHGRGVMKFADGRTFEGEYIGGQMIEGKMTYQDGSTYNGSWVDGMRHGHGKCVFTDLSIYEGEFREGEFFGHGKMSWSDGGYYEGEWWNGEMHGRGKEVRPDGSVRHDGMWSKGQPIRK